MLEKLIKSESLYGTATAGFIFAGLILIFGPSDWWPEFYTPRFYGSVFLISAMIIMASRQLLKSDDEQRIVSAYHLRFIILAGLCINAAGELYLYQLYKFGFQFDKFAHLANSFLFVFAIVTFSKSWSGFDFAQALKTAIVIVATFALGWEMAEFVSDELFRTKEFGMYGEMKTIDTALDLTYDLLGIGLALLILRHENEQPAANLHEKLTSRRIAIRGADHRRHHKHAIIVHH